MSIKIGDLVAIPGNEFACGYMIGIVYDKRRLRNLSDVGLDLPQDYTYLVEWSNMPDSDPLKRSEYIHRLVDGWHRNVLELKQKLTRSSENHMYNPQIGDLLFDDETYGIGMIIMMDTFDARPIENCDKITAPNDRTYYINWMTKDDTTAYPYFLVEQYRDNFILSRDSLLMSQKLCRSSSVGMMPNPVTIRTK